MLQPKKTKYRNQNKEQPSEPGWQMKKAGDCLNTFNCCGGGIIGDLYRIIRGHDAGALY